MGRDMDSSADGENPAARKRLATGRGKSTKCSLGAIPKTGKIQQVSGTNQCSGHITEVSGTNDSDECSGRNLKIEVSNLKETNRKNKERIQKNAELIAELRKQLAEKTNEGEDVQEIAWRKYIKEENVQTLQKEKHYGLTKVDGVDTHPHAKRISRELGNFHPEPTSLNLEWSPLGEWHRVPKTKNQQGGPENHSYNVGRIEYYVDTCGVKRRAMAYGYNSDQLLVWYDVEDMLRAMEWVIPDTSPWVNSRRWKNKFRISPLPKIKSAGGAPRGGSQRGSVPRGSAQRGRIYTQTQRGRGRGQGYTEDRREESNSYSRGRHQQQDPDWGQYDGLERDRRSSGPGNIDDVIDINQSCKKSKDSINMDILDFTNYVYEKTKNFMFRLFL